MTSSRGALFSRGDLLSRSLTLFVFGCLLLWPATTRSENAAARDEDRYPDMAEWAQAGVTGGIPAPAPTTLTVPAGGDIAAALASLPPTGGVVQLAAGEYVLNSTIQLKDHVVLRGASDAVTKLHLKLRGAFPRDVGQQWSTGLLLERAEFSGLEKLTISFDESLPAPPTLRTDPAAFVNNPHDRTDLFVVAVRLTDSHDCWVRDVRIINSGSHPLMIERCRHITALNVTIDGAHNKGDWGNGYLNVTKSEYVLLDRLNVRDIRHLSIQNHDEVHPCRFNVLIRSELLVDVNFHNGDSGHNLVQDCTVEVPTWHWWGPFSAGAADKHQPPGPGNLIFRCTAGRTFPTASRNTRVATDPTKVYVMRTNFDRAVPIVTEFGSAPTGGTLYVPRWSADNSVRN